MPLSKFVASVALTVALGAAAFAAYAQDLMPDPSLAGLSAEEAVAKRQEIMHLNVETMGSAGELSGADAVKAAETLAANFTNLAVLFPEGSDKVDGTRAKAEIWQNWGAFAALLAKGVAAAETMKTAAEAGDATAYGAAVGAVGGVCGECHGQFRS